MHLQEPKQGIPRENGEWAISWESIACFITIHEWFDFALRTSRKFSAKIDKSTFHLNIASETKDLMQTDKSQEILNALPRLLLLTSYL